MTERQTEALERLNQGIQESRQEVQQRTMNLAQEYFGDSAEVLKQQIRENRATLESLPDQIPGGARGSLPDIFSGVDGQLLCPWRSASTRRSKTSPTWTRIRSGARVRSRPRTRPVARQRSGAWTLRRSRARAADGRIIVSDVVEAAEAMEDGAAEDEAASEAARSGPAGAGRGRTGSRAGPAGGGTGHRSGRTGSRPGPGRRRSGHQIRPDRPSRACRTP